MFFTSPSQRADLALSSCMPSHSFPWFWIHFFSNFFLSWNTIVIRKLHYFYQTVLSFFWVASTKFRVLCLPLSTRAESNAHTLVYLPSISLTYAVELLFGSFSCRLFGGFTNSGWGSATNISTLFKFYSFAYMSCLALPLHEIFISIIKINAKNGILQYWKSMLKN